MTESINPHIFRAYDIRGLVDIDLTEETLHLLGRAKGTYLRSQHAKTFVVGRDARCSSPQFQKAFMHGLTSTGIDVIDIGETPTPLMYFAVEHLKADGGATISASHNPPEYNGVKFRRSHPTYGSEPFSGDSLELVRTIANTGQFAAGHGTVRKVDVQDAYIQRVVQTLRMDDVCHNGIRPRIVLDGGNGVAGPLAMRTLEALGIEVIPLYIEPDGRFPNHHPDPLKVENLRDLSVAVQTHGANLGLALDGDGDRLGIVDERGKIVWADRYMIVLARYLFMRQTGTVVFDIKCSSVLADAIRSFGGTPIMWKTGYASILSKMHETNAILGGELSGHIFSTYPYHYYDDGTFAGSHLIRALCQFTLDTRQGKSLISLAKILEPYPELPSLKDDRLRFTDTTKFQVVDYVRKHFQQYYPINDIDGVRIDFHDGWGVVRASNTEPVITMGFEATTEKRVQEIRSMVLDVINEFQNTSSNEPIGT